ncbi:MULTISPECIES: sensor histidine kinase [Sphingomonas]|uniref:sensor histidine kinase n=1 Tax=Sphingomonas TaxID=13687 RepID=UPI000DEEB335|nr:MULTISPECIES: HAMP domain-containing sensor histidine kinase [Sphingomonas]
MASAAFEPVRGQLDQSGRLTAADPRLIRLQEEAGGGLGAALAVPQLAAIARLCSQLGVSLSRQALAATGEADLDLWVRADPSPNGVALSIESWIERPPRPRRFRVIEGTGADESERDADLLIDGDLKIQTVGKALAALLGETARGAPGQPLTRLFELLPSAEGDLPMLSAVAARRAFERQGVRVRASGRELSLSGSPRLTASEDFLGFSLHVEQPEVRAERPPADFDQGFDNLLRQPLDVIMGEAARIAEKGEGPLRSDYAGYAADIASAARHLLLVLQGMSAERPAPAPERIDLAELALEAAGLVQVQATEAGIVFDVDGPPSLPTLGDARSVTQILVNLLSNAVRHSPKGKIVRVTCAGGSDVSVTVSDEGTGVAPADQQRIFERFEQAEPRTDGAGLGLAISRRYARQMGGDITLDSKPGEGANFTLRLPAA